MAEKTKPIKSLDELKQGDVVGISPFREGPYIVSAIGDVPQHEREVVLNRLFSPDFINNRTYERITFTESNINEIYFKLIKLNRQDYSGWKYLTVQTTE